VRRIGLLTIGQTPRTDLVSAMRPLIGEGVELLEAGCLDGLDPQAVAALAPGPADYVLTTRLADGSSVLVGRRPLEARLAEKVRELVARGASAVVPLSTGDFSQAEVEAPVPLLYPDRILAQAVRAVLQPGRTVAVLTPLPSQVEQVRRKWRPILGERLVVLAATPYDEAAGAVAAAGDRLRQARADLVIMDCMAYLPSMKAIVRERAGCPVMLANSVVARTLGELV
jgi:protein AroM